MENNSKKDQRSWRMLIGNVVREERGEERKYEDKMTVTMALLIYFSLRTSFPHKLRQFLLISTYTLGYAFYVKDNFG